MTSGPILVDAGSLVASGAAMDFNATEHTMSLNTFWTVPDIPAKPVGSSYNDRLAEGKYVGFTNPTHQITGFYDDTGLSYTHDLSGKGYYFMTGSMLKGISISGSVFALIDSEVIKASNFGEGSMVYVVPIGYNVIRNPNSGGKDNRGYMVNYSMNFKEIKV